MENYLMNSRVDLLFNYIFPSLHLRPNFGTSNRFGRFGRFGRPRGVPVASASGPGSFPQ